MTQTLLIVFILLAATWLAVKAPARVRLSRAKHRSLAGHARIAKRVARLIPFYDFDESAFFDVDGAPGEVRAAREQGFERLAQLFRQNRPHSRSALSELKARAPTSPSSPAIACRSSFPVWCGSGFRRAS